MNVHHTITILILNIFLIGIVIGILIVILTRKKRGPRTIHIIKNAGKYIEDDKRNDDGGGEYDVVDNVNASEDELYPVDITCQKASDVLDEIEKKKALLESSEGLNSSEDLDYINLDERDDVHGSCSESSHFCRSHASCTSDNVIKSGCHVILENNGVKTRYACPADCCKRSVLETI